MKGVFIFNDKSGLIFWNCDGEMFNRLRRHVQTFSSNDENCTNVELNSTMLAYYFLPLLTTFRAYTLFAEDSIRQIRAKNISLTFSPHKTFTLLTICPSTVSIVKINRWHQNVKSMFNFLYSTFQSAFESFDLKLQSKLLTDLITDKTLNVDYVIPYVAIDGVINVNNVEAKRYLQNVADSLSRSWPSSACFFISDHQLIALSKARIPRNQFLISSDIQKLLYLANESSITSEDNVIDSLVFLGDRQTRNHFPYCLLKWRLSTGVYVLIISPLGHKEVLSCLNELNLALFSTQNDFDEELTQLANTTLFSLLMKLQRLSTSYGQVSINCSKLREAIQTFINTDKSLIKNVQLVFSAKLAEWQKIFKMILCGFWRHLKEESAFIKQEFDEKVLNDILCTNVMKENLHSCLAELPPLPYQGPSPSDLKLNVKSYCMLFHMKNVSIGFGVDVIYESFEFENLLRRHKEENLLIRKEHLTVVQSSWTNEDCWTVLTVFEPFINKTLALKETGILTRCLNKKVNVAFCKSF